MPNYRKLKLSSRSFGLSEKTTPRKSWSESTPLEVYLKIGRVDFQKKKRRRMSGNSAIGSGWKKEETKSRGGS